MRSDQPLQIRIFLLAVVIACCCNWAHSQNRFERFSKTKYVEIPFELENNFIIVNVTVNQTLPLRFIFDTGAEHTILTKRELAVLLRLKFVKEFQIMGADMMTILVAYLVRRVRLDVGDAISPVHDILVLKEDYIRVDEYSGKAIHGILGADFFRHFVVKIDYEKQRITLFNHRYFRKEKYGTPLPLEFARNKPYLMAQTEIAPDTTVSLKYLLDTGASLPLLIHHDTHESVRLPDRFIKGSVGFGLGGAIEGYMGRTPELRMGEHIFSDLVTSYQATGEFQDSLMLNGRNGIIGNDILKRFEVTINYIDRELYLRPIKRYADKEIRYDRSGLVVTASGANLNQFRVQYVVEDSPAGLAGVRKDDRILAINGIPVRMISLQTLVNKFQKKEGKRIRLKIKRESKKHKITFYLRDLI